MGSDDPPALILYAIFKKQIELFPTSSKASETLADIYYNFEKKEPAIKYYGKALELDPRNTNVQKRLKELKDK